MSTFTPGRRVDLTEDHKFFDMVPGDYAKADNGWWVYPPQGDAGPIHIREGQGWALIENEDGTLTVGPSIWVNRPNGWHGFLKDGTWETLP